MTHTNNYPIPEGLKSKTFENILKQQFKNNFVKMNQPITTQALMQAIEGVNNENANALRKKASSPEGCIISPAEHQFYQDIKDGTEVQFYAFGVKLKGIFYRENGKSKIKITGYN